MPLETLVGLARQLPGPEHLLECPTPQLRAAGLSANKVLALRDLAAKTLDGTVPSLARIRRMSDDDIIDRLILPLVDEAVPEWQRTLDALLALPGIRGPVGFAGGVIAIGTRLAIVEPRIVAAILFAGSFIPRTVLEEAGKVTIPLHVLLQWDDEGNDRQLALDLFDAFGSKEKTLHANTGGHTGVPAFAGEAAGRFLARHLRPGDQYAIGGGGSR